MTDKANLHMEKRSPVQFMKSIFAIERFSKKKTNKPLPTLTKKLSIKNVKRPPRNAKLPPMKVYQNPISKPPFPLKEVKIKRDTNFASAELSLALTKATPSGTFYRGSSGNVMLVSNLGSLKTKSSNVTPLKNEAKVIPKIVSSKFVVKPLIQELDPERLKVEGNENHKKGKFEEALALYNQAILLDPKRASYYSNKSAALMGLGRLIEAIYACREAIQIDPSYERAHHRLATLYFRLGEADKSLYHYLESGPKADSKDIAKTKALKTHLAKYKKAKEVNNWDLIVQESLAAISSGADSAPQIYAMLVEALLKLHRHQEAYDKYQQGPCFNIESCGQIFGSASCTYLSTVQAQVYLAVGRFDDAETICRQVTRYSSDDEVKVIAKRVNAMVLSRSKGNKLFKVCKFLEASTAYSEGLDHDPHNATLLCNRAICKLKSQYFREALEDCNGALRLIPTYSKARMTRAECYVKLENWEAATQDYETLVKETPEDQTLNQAMLEAKLQLRKQRRDRDSGTNDMQVCSNFVSISTYEQFEHLATSPGICVVLFCKRKGHKQVMELMERVCKEFPSFNFLKVETEDHSLLAKSEGALVPSFMIYKDGLKVQDISGRDHTLLEKSLKSYHC